MEQEKNKESTKESILKTLKDVKSELSKYRKQFESDWKEYDDAYYGKQHKTGDSIKTVKNHVFRIIESEVPVLSDSMPGTLITATRADKQAAADILQKSIKWVYNDQSLILKLPTLQRASLRSAPGFLSVKYNPDSDGGDGKVELKQIPWRNVWLDGNAQTLEDAKRAIIEEPRRRGDLIMDWPEREVELKEVQNDTKDESAEDSNFEKRDVEGLKVESGSPLPAKSKDILIYRETWIKSNELEEIPVDEVQEEIQEEITRLQNGESSEVEKWQNHKAHIEALSTMRAGILAEYGVSPDIDSEELEMQAESIVQQNPQAAEQISSALLQIKIIDNQIEEHEELLKINPSGKRPKYEDGWRLIKSVCDVILYDGPNPEQDGMIDLVPFYCYKDETIYGFGEIKNILNAQRSFNDMDFRELEGLKLCSNPGWVADTESEVDENKLTNAPGLVVKKKRGTEVRRLEPGQVSPQLQYRKDFDKDSMDSIAGVNEESFNGALPSGNVAAVTFEKVQSQSVGRIRLKDRLLQGYSMKRLAMLVASRILNHWTAEKSLRLRDDAGKIEDIIFNPLEMEDLDYQVDISQSSMAGIDKKAINSFYYGLLQGGFIDVNTFLTVAEIPKKEIVLARLEEQATQQQEVNNQEVQAQMQALQEQLVELQKQNIALKGALDQGKVAKAELLMPEEKKVFDQLLKDTAINDLVSQEETISPEQMGAMSANPNEGMI